MNILALTSSYPRYEGDPTAPFIESIVRGIAARGHTVHLVLPATRDWDRPAQEDGVHYHLYRYSPLRTWTPWGFSESLQAGVRIKRPLYALAPAVLASALHACRKLLARECFDLAHAHWVVPNGPIGALAVRRPRLPLVVSLHGSDVSVSERSKAIGRATRWAFDHASAVTAPSEDLLLRSRALGATGALEAIPYGADVAALAPDPDTARAVRERLALGADEIVVAGIGRFVHWKGFDYLIDAFAKARTSVPELRLVLVGDGDLRDDLRARAATLGVADSVTFAGMVGREEIAAYFAATDIVAVPSVHFDGYVDGLPNVALEAMASGTPVVATRVGGLPQLVRPGENGLLVEEKNSAQLADGLVALASNPELRARLGENARAEIRDERSWESVAERFVSVYSYVTRTRRETRGA